MPQLSKRLVVVSNRLPIILTKQKGIGWNIQPGSGGLVTALTPVMRENHGLWIGWTGYSGTEPLEEQLLNFSKQQSYDLLDVPLTQEEEDKYYRGFSNESLWPLFHDLLGYCKFRLDHWNAYNDVNRKFAQVIYDALDRNDFLWVHDYQLTLVGHYLRQLNVSLPIAYFLHIPFPSLDLFRRLPWKQALIEGLLQYDMLGFQTLRDRRNFINCVRGFFPKVRIDVKTRHTLIHYDNRIIRIGNYPISIDFEEFNSKARTKEVADAAWYVHENFPNQQLVLGIDRLDYTKGIPERFLAFERMLEKYPDIHGKVTLLQVVVPSRTKVPEYRSLKEVLDEQAGRINARYTKHGWIPIHYMFRHLDRTQLIGHYQACEIGLVTPLRDGMNLIAKEYCASSLDYNGVLLLSEFAGASEQLAKGAVLVNPFDLEGTADAIYKSLKMEPQERKRRMQILMSEVKRNDVHKWLQWILQSFIESKKIK